MAFNALTPSVVLFSHFVATAFFKTRKQFPNEFMV